MQLGLFSKKRDEETPVYVGEAVYQALAHSGIQGGDNEDDEWLSVVGESFYQKELEAILAGLVENGMRYEPVLAMVAFQPNNPHDGKAIAVSIGGKIIGHISREDQAEVARLIRKVEAFEGKAGFAAARLIGGWDNGEGDKGMIGVELDI